MKSKIVCSLLLASSFVFTGCINSNNIEQSSNIDGKKFDRFAININEVKECPDYKIVSSSSSTSLKPKIEKDTATNTETVVAYIIQTEKVEASACKNKDTLYLEVIEGKYSSVENNQKLNKN